MENDCRICGKKINQLQERNRTRCNGCNTKLRRIRAKLKGIELLGGKCKNCGFDKHPAALHFHHRDPEGKEFDIGRFCNKSWDVVEAEIIKCDLLCANCHAELHSNRYNELMFEELKTYGKKIRNFSNTDLELKIISDRKSGMSYKDLMIKYNIDNRSTINNLINRKVK